MPPPASEAVIRLGSEGGAQTARDINQTAGAMTELGSAAKGMISEFNQKPNVSGWADVGRGMVFAATETSKFSGGLVGLTKSIEDARVELGGFGLALELVPGLTLVEMATGAWAAREEALTRHLVEKNKELRATVDLLDRAERAGAELTESQKDLAKRSAEMSEELRQEHLERAKLNLERMKERGALSWLQEMQYRQFLQYGQSRAAADLLREATTEYNLELAKTTVEVEALEKRFGGFDDQMQKTTAMLVGQQRALQKVRNEHRMSREALELVDPSKRAAMEVKGIEQIKNAQLAAVKVSTQRYNLELENIERGRQARLVAMSADVTDEQEYADALKLINATTANESAMAWELHAQRVATANKGAAAKVKAEWAGAAAAMTSAVQGFATKMVDVMQGGSMSAADAFKELANIVVAQTIRMAAQMLVMKTVMGALTGGAATPVISAAGMFQHGGTIPAPRGQAVNIIAHGGERVVSDTGRGAPVGGEGGGTTNVYQFKTGVLTPDSQRTMIRQISRTQRGTGEKAFPQ